MRLFLAIDLPAEAKKKLFSELTTLREEYRQFVWVPEQNYNILLHFFGELDYDVKKIKAQVEEMVFDMKPFYMFSTESGIFINKKILLFVAYRREKSLEIIAERIKEKYAPDSTIKFVPNSTIGRFKVPSKQQYLLLKKKLSNLYPEIEFKVDRISLFETVTSGKVPTYKKIHDFKLKK